VTLSVAGLTNLLNEVIASLKNPACTLPAPALCLELIASEACCSIHAISLFLAKIGGQILTYTPDFLGHAAAICFSPVDIIIIAPIGFTLIRPESR
jgi:hypothetical protein